MPTSVMYLLAPSSVIEGLSKPSDHHTTKKIKINLFPFQNEKPKKAVMKTKTKDQIKKVTIDLGAKSAEK